MSADTATERSPTDDLRQRIDDVVAALPPQVTVDALMPYLTAERVEKIERVLTGRTESLSIAVESPSDPHNAAAIVRTAEALGVMAVHVVTPEGRALHKRATTQGAFRWVDTHHHETLEALVKTQRSRRVRLCGAAMDGSTPLPRMALDEPLCLLFGNEQRGLSSQARAACDELFHIPMVGMSESLNLSVSAAIAMHHVVSHRSDAGLSEARCALWRARYFARSVDPRLVLGLLAPGEVSRR